MSKLSKPPTHYDYYYYYYGIINTYNTKESFAYLFLNLLRNSEKNLNLKLPNLIS
jgi:hypothetical protein